MLMKPTVVLLPSCASGSTATSLFYPGKTKKTMEWFGAAPLTARGREIAKNREELLGLLHGLPAQTEFELSLTDLVESSSSSTSTDHDHFNKQEERTRNVNQLQEGQHHPDKEETGKKARKSSSSSSSSFGRSRSSSSSSRGVLLNMYFPTKLTRSLTSSSGSRSSARPKDAAPEFTKRYTEEPILFSCWSAIWYRKSDKSRQERLHK